MKFLTEALIYLVQAAFWSGIACPIGISFFWPWWKHSLGWTIMLYDGCFTLFLVAFNLSFEFGWNVNSIQWYAVLDASLAISTAILIWRTFLIARQQYLGAKKKGNGNDEASADSVRSG